MSSPAQSGPSSVQKKEKGIKFLTRVKTVLRKADRRLSQLSSKPAPADSAKDAADASQAAAQAYPDAVKVPRAQIYAERAKKLAEIHGLDVKPSQWYSSDGHVLRVEKPIKMRVHRKCHKCDTTFGANKQCSKCKHNRCKQCPRIPPKRTEAEKEASRAKRAALQKEHKPLVVEWDPQQHKKPVLKRPSKTGGQDLIYRKPRQRVRRTCCQCNTLFRSGVKICQSCNHGRCTDCPRDPAKKEKYPYGYPNDGPGMKTAHYECPKCKEKYSVPSQAPAVCPKCKHQPGARIKPHKVEPEPDPEVLKSLNARLEALKLSAK